MSASVQNSPKLPGFLSLLLVVILGITTAKLMWLIITPKQHSVAQTQASETIAIQNKEKINYGKLIANQHLFGVVQVKKAAITPTKQTTAKNKTAPTKLNLTLHGIFFYKASKGGYALISSSNGPQKVYGIGDSLQKGVTVSEIFPSKVVLDNHGKNEELKLPVKTSKTQKTHKLSPNLPGMNDRSPNSGRFNNPSKVDLESIRRDALRSPQKLLAIASPSAAIVNGKFIGFRVQPGRKRQVFKQLGFRPNDIITEVNGIVLDDYSKGIALSAELENANELSITVKRGSQIINLPVLQF